MYKLYMRRSRDRSSLLPENLFLEISLQVINSYLFHKNRCMKMEEPTLRMHVPTATHFLKRTAWKKLYIPMLRKRSAR